MKLALNIIRRDGGTQSRVLLNDEVVGDYAEAMREGVAFPPVVIFFDGTDYWLADGFHRVEAASVAELGEVEADVRQGTRRDAVLFACGANAVHGLRRTNADKRRAVETLLRDEEWAAWSNVKIAKACGVATNTVKNYRDAIMANCQDAARKVERNGVVYEQDTANIGRAPDKEPRRPKFWREQAAMKIDAELRDLTDRAIELCQDKTVRTLLEDVLLDASRYLYGVTDGSSFDHDGKPIVRLVR